MKARQLELRAIPQFDSGRWKLRLERVPLDPDNEATMDMEFDSAAQTRVNDTNEAHWSLLPIERGRRERDKHPVERYERPARLLTESFGYRLIDESGNRFRFASADSSASGRIIDLLCQPDTAMGRVAAGSVHHIAFRAKDDAEQLQWREHLVDLGYNVTPMMDRAYFHSIYFREPGGVLFEIATEPPGFTLDEPIDELGSKLRLPTWMEAARSQIDQVLPPIKIPGQQ